MLHTLLSGRDHLPLPILHLPKLPLTREIQEAFSSFPFSSVGVTFLYLPTGLWSHQYPGPNTLLLLLPWVRHTVGTE